MLESPPLKVRDVGDRLPTLGLVFDSETVAEKPIRIGCCSAKLLLASSRADNTVKVVAPPWFVVNLPLAPPLKMKPEGVRVMVPWPAKLVAVAVNWTVPVSDRACTSTLTEFW